MDVGAIERVLELEGVAVAQAFELVCDNGREGGAEERAFGMLFGKAAGLEVDLVGGAEGGLHRCYRCGVIRDLLERGVGPQPEIFARLIECE